MNILDLAEYHLNKMTGYKTQLEKLEFEKGNSFSFRKRLSIYTQGSINITDKINFHKQAYDLLMPI